jgi:mono/diheme cytochrome c family protein
MWRTNLRILAVTLGVIGFYTTIAHIIPQLHSDVPEALALGGDASPEALAGAGEKVFNGVGGCTACHGLGTRAPNLVTDFAGQGPIGARCGTRKQGMDCKAYLYESLVKPGAFVVQGFEPIMPDMSKQLADDQLWAVVAYLESQGGEVTVTASDIKKPAATGGAPGAAAPAMSATLDPVQLYNEKGCVGCHQLDGKGGAIGPSWDHVGSRRTADRIRRKILSPASDTTKGYEKFAGVMPPTYGQQLSAAQLEALVSYLASRK